MQPDLLVACDLEGNVTEKGRYMGTPTLVVEILSESTRNKDMIDKLNTYMLSGVKEYWIVDQKQESITIYSFAGCAIDRYKFYEKDAMARSFVFDGLATDPESIFADLI